MFDKWLLCGYGVGDFLQYRNSVQQEENLK